MLQTASLNLRQMTLDPSQRERAQEKDARADKSQAESSKTADCPEEDSNVLTRYLLDSPGLLPIPAGEAGRDHRGRHEPRGIGRVEADGRAARSDPQASAADERPAPGVAAEEGELGRSNLIDVRFGEGFHPI
jgi:hypothetical protein